MDALLLFLEQKKMLPEPSSELCQNIGHTWNMLGEYKLAEESLTEALEIIKEKGDKRCERASVLLGLGTVQEERGNLQQALETRQEALDAFKAKFKNAPHSLIA